MKEILKTSNNIIELLSNCDIKDAINTLHSYVLRTDNTELISKVEEIDNIYKSGLDFTIAGVVDPDKDKIKNKILLDIIEITDRSREYLLSKESNYIKTYVRSKIGKSNLKISDQIENYKLISSIKSGVGLIENDMLAEELFMSIIVSDAIDADDVSAVKELLSNPNIELGIKCIIVSAFMLSNNRFFHKNKVMIIIDSYYLGNTELSVRALFAILFTLHIYSFRIYTYNDLKQRVTLLMSDSNFVSELRMMMMATIKTNDSKQTTEKIESEIIPEIKKISHNLIDKIEAKELEVNDINPQWIQDSDNNIYDKFDELSSMQKSGFDIFINAFAELKNFSFFDKWSNWFMPYDENHVSILLSNDTDVMKVAKTVKNIPFMCDSDKYSFVLNVPNIPKLQRDLLVNTFESESENIADDAKDNLMFSKPKILQMPQYVQNVYRFMKLLRYKPGITDIFKLKLDFFDKPIFAPLFDNEELKSLANYYFKIKNYSKALAIFLKLSENYYDDVAIYEKMGYCYQQQGDISRAVEYYEKSTQIDNNHLWASLRLAYCYKQLNQRYDALRVYLEALGTYPDNKALIYDLICLYIELDNHEKALQYAYKMEYFEPDNANVIRAIGWCKFILGDFDTSLNYFNRLIPNHNKTDLLNMGHIFLAKNELAEAIPYYMRSIEMYAKESKDFFTAFKADVKCLLDNNITQETINDITDYLKYYLG